MSGFQLAEEASVEALLSCLVVHIEERAVVSEAMQHVLGLIDVRHCLDELVARVVVSEEEAAEKRRRNSASYIDDSLFASIMTRFMSSSKPSSAAAAVSVSTANSPRKPRTPMTAVAKTSTHAHAHVHASFPLFKELLEEHEERQQSNVIMYRPPPRTPRTPKALAISEPLLVLANQREAREGEEEEEEKENTRGKAKAAQAAATVPASTPRGMKVSRRQVAVVVNVPPAATAAAVKVARVEHFPIKPTHLRPSSSGSSINISSGGSSRAARFNFSSKADPVPSLSLLAASEGEATAFFDDIAQEASFANTNTNSFFQCVFSPPPSAPAPPSSPSPLTSASIPVSSSFTASTAAPASAASTRGLAQSPFLPRSLVNNLHRTYGTKPTPKHEAVPNPRRDVL